MHYLRLILAGALFGAGFYFAPFFLVRFFIFGLFAFAVIRLLIGPRWGWGRGYDWAYAGHPGSPAAGYGPLGFADKVRSMTETEYKAFQDGFSQGPYGRRCYGRGRHAAQAQPSQPASSSENPSSAQPNA